MKPSRKNFRQRAFVLITSLLADVLSPIRRAGRTRRFLWPSCVFSVTSVSSVAKNFSSIRVNSRPFVAKKKRRVAPFCKAESWSSPLRTSQQPGFVLITVLLLVALLAAILLHFNAASRASVNACDAFVTRLQAANCARAGFEYAIATITQNPDPQTNPLLNRMLSGRHTIDIGPGACAVSLAAENGKLNVNLLRDDNGKLDRARIDQLLRLIDILNRRHRNMPLITYDLVPAIIDWIDPDDTPTVLPFVHGRNAGAESSHYRAAGKHPAPANQPMQTTDELLLVKGMSPLKVSFPRKRESRGSDASLLDLLTVYGDGKIDINSAPPLVLQCLSDRIDPVLANLIVAHRKHQPFSTIDQLQQVPGITAALHSTLANVLTTNPQHRYYRLTADGAVGSAAASVIAIIKSDSTSSTAEVILYNEP